MLGSETTGLAPLQVGLGKHFWINVLLTILGYVPGIATPTERRS